MIDLFKYHHMQDIITNEKCSPKISHLIAKKPEDLK